MRHRFRFRFMCFLLLTALVARPQMLTPQVQAGQGVPVLSVTMTRSGPSPSSATIPSGAFVLAIQNHWKAMGDTFTLSLSAPAGSSSPANPPLLTILPAQHKNLDYQLMSLQPGAYQLTFSNHPSWTVSMTVTAAQ